MGTSALSDQTRPDRESLLALARDRSIPGREALAASVANMVSDRGEDFSEQEEALAGDILRTLIKDVERSVRQALAANLAGAKAAPRDVILALAYDEVEVAFPVLAESPVLRDEELIDIVTQKASGHRIAIAMRPGIGEGVSSALLKTGDPEAVVCLLHNNDAAISKKDLASVVAAAWKHSEYQPPLSERPDLSPELALKLAGVVAETLRARLVERYELDPKAVAAAAESAAQDAADELSDSDSAEVAAVTEDDRMNIKRRDVRQMIDSLRRNEWPHFEAAMVRFAGLPTKLTHAILAERDGRRLTVLCRAGGMEKSDFAPLFLLSRRATPDVEVVDARDVREALALFDNIDRAAAARVVARWRIEAAAKTKRRFGAAG